MVTGILVQRIAAASDWRRGLADRCDSDACTFRCQVFIGEFGVRPVAGMQSMLVFILVQPDKLQFAKTADALLGAAMALAVTALIPRDPRGLAKLDANRLFDTFLRGPLCAQTRTRAA
jgi:hypothetical protein